MIEVFTYDDCTRSSETAQVATLNALGELMGYIQFPWSSPTKGRLLNVSSDDSTTTISLLHDDVTRDSRTTFSGTTDEMRLLMNALGAYLFVYNRSGRITFQDNEYHLPVASGGDAIMLATMWGLGYDFDMAFNLATYATTLRAKDVVAVHDLAVDTGKSFTEVLALL